MSEKTLVKQLIEVVEAPVAAKAVVPNLEDKCQGKCGHARSFHVVKFLGGDPNVRACAKVDCACMEFIAPKPVEEPAKA